MIKESTNSLCQFTFTGAENFYPDTIQQADLSRLNFLLTCESKLRGRLPHYFCLMFISNACGAALHLHNSYMCFRSWPGQAFINKLLTYFTACSCLPASSVGELNLLDHCRRQNVSLHPLSPGCDWVNNHHRFTFKFPPIRHKACRPAQSQVSPAVTNGIYLFI